MKQCARLYETADKDGKAKTMAYYTYYFTASTTAGRIDRKSESNQSHSPHSDSAAGGMAFEKSRSDLYYGRQFIVKRTIFVVPKSKVQKPNKFLGVLRRLCGLVY